MLLKTILNRQAKSYSIQVGFLTPSAMAPTAEMEPATPIRSAQQEGEVVTVLAPWVTVSVVPVSKAMSPMNGKEKNLISVTLNCGGRTYQNCTYLENVGTEVGACSVTICPGSDNICQLRLDFETIDGFQTRIFPCSNKEQFDGFRTD